MSQKPTDISDSAAPSSSDNSLTVVVFKESRAARTFQLPANWIARLGWYIGTLSVLTVVALSLAGKYYWTASHLGPSRVHELEDQLSGVKTQLAQAQSAAAMHVNPTPTAATSVNPVAPVVAAALPAPTVTVTATATVTSGPVSNETAIYKPVVAFSAFPPKVQGPPSDPNTVPIRVENLKTTWQGSKLHVRFELQYWNTDGGTQNGRIIILARGLETVLAYPEGVLNDASGGALISPDNGEYFSVSRFRETNADFGPVASRAALKTIQILILNQNGQLLIDQKIKVTTGAAGTAARKTQGNGNSNAE